MGMTSDFVWWELWTSHLWHWNAPHLVLNVLAAIPPLLVLPRRMLSLLLPGVLAGAPLLSLFIIATGFDGEYRGASGLVVALWVFAAIVLLRTRNRGAGLVLLSAIAMKLSAEHWGFWQSPGGGFEPLRRVHYAGAILGLAFAFVAGSARAETKLVVSSILVDPSMVAPVVRLYGDRGEGTSYEIGLSGWTIDGEWQKKLTDNRSRVLAVEATPFHAHNSNRIYVSHVLNRDLEYDNAAYRVSAGLRFSRNPASVLDVRLVGLYEDVDRVAEAVADRWSSPYAGINVTQTWSKIRAREPLIASFDGFEAVARGEVFAGKRTWGRVSITESAGRTFGRIHVMQSAAAMFGTGLDVVNRFVVGGSWDTLRGTAVYGLRYGELRLRRGLIGSAGVDYRFAGNWRAGVRGSWVDSDAVTAYSRAIHVSTIIRTIGADVGIGRPPKGDPIVYATLIIPLYRK